MEKIPASTGQGQTALLVIDVQQGLFGKSTPIYKAEGLLDNITALVNKAHRSGILVVYVQHCQERLLAQGSQDWQLHPRLQPQETDIVVLKQHGNAFEATNLDAILKSKNITTVVVTGLVTHGCVQKTCLGAKQLGYQVILVSDGHSNYSQKAAQLIADWHEKLGDLAVTLKTTSEIEF